MLAKYVIFNAQADGLYVIKKEFLSMLRNILIGLEYKMATARKMVLEPASETS
jgi:hypothetical protein